MDALRGQREDLRVAAAEAGLNAANNMASLFGYMSQGGGNAGGSNAIWGAGTFDQSIFTNAGSQMSQLQAMNSARNGIENRARELVNEIGRDRAMGRDVSDRQEALSNLTGNLDILNRNLSNSIDRALSENGGGRDANTVDVLGRIRDTIASRAPEGSLVPNEVPTPTNAPEAPANAQAAAETPETPANAQAAAETEPASFEVPAAFEGSVAEATAAASQEQSYDEMSVAAQIASNAQSDHAEAIDIMNDEAQAVAPAENPTAAPEMIEE
jgi:hypothetical protein